MKSFRLHWLAVAALFLLASCSKTNKQGRLVPKDAAMVLHINGESVNSKLPWDEIKSNPAFQQMYKDSTLPESMKQVLDNPDNSGIDIKTDLVIFMMKDSTGAYVGITGTVKDAEKFKTFNLSASKGTATEKDGISYIAKAPVCVGWNKDKFVYVIDAPQMAKASSFSNINDDEPVARDLGATCRSVFELKESNSMAKDDKFSALMSNKGDAHFWMNAEQFYSGMGSMGSMMSMIKLNKLYEGSITTATANFDNGKIDVEYKSYVGKALKDLVKKYSGGDLDENMLKRIPSKDVAVAFAFHFKPEGIKELLKALDLEPIVNMALVFAGFSMDDFVKANKGDLVFALTDFKMKTDSLTMHDIDGKITTFPKTKMEPNFIFATAVNDKDAFGKLIQAAKKVGGNMPGDGDNKMAYNTNNGFFVLSNSQDNVEKYLAGNANSNFDFIKKVSGNPFGGYINIQTMLKSMETEMGKDSSSIEVYNASLKFWDNAYITGGDYSDGGLTYKFEINLLDKSTNSLKQLNQYLGVVGKHMEQKKKDEIDWEKIEEVRPDSTVKSVPVPKN